MGKPRRTQNSSGEWKCSKCNEYKSESEFHRSRASTNGLTARCSLCIRINTAWRYGLTEERYLAMLEEQQGLCACCGKPERAKFKGKVKVLSIDHDHNCCPYGSSCGLCVRALLCSGCNSGHGITESPALLRAKADYLDRWVPVLAARYATGNCKTKREGSPTSGKQGLSKLTPDQVREILNSDESNKTLSLRYNVHQSTISAIKVGRSWKSITGDQTCPPTRSKD